MNHKVSDERRQQVINQLRRFYLHGYSCDFMTRSIPTVLQSEQKMLIDSIHLHHELRLQRKILRQYFILMICTLYILSIFLLRFIWDINWQYGFGLLLIAAVTWMWSSVRFLRRYRRSKHSFQSEIR